MRGKTSLLLTGLLLLAAAVVWAGGEALSLQIREGALRASPSFLGPVVATLGYGDRVDLLHEQGPWAKVRDGDGAEGWIHRSALTEKRIVMAAGEEDLAAAASGEELALAGKGFNSEVEAEYRRRHGLDFTWVDRMEEFRVTPAQSLDFLSEGELTGEEVTR